MEANPFKKLRFSGGRKSKHEMPVFPTIRLEDKFGEEGWVVRVRVHDKGNLIDEFPARIVKKEKRKLEDIPNKFLEYDTETENWEEAIKSLLSYYDEDVDEDHEWTIYWCKKMEFIPLSKIPPNPDEEE